MDEWCDKKVWYCKKVKNQSLEQDINSDQIYWLFIWLNAVKIPNPIMHY